MPSHAPSTSHPSLAALLALFALVAAGWAWAIPPFEKPDELGHFAYVRFVATEHRLPVQGQDGPWVEAEDQQPPAYYLVAAQVWRLARGLGVRDVRLSEIRMAPALDRPDAPPPARVRYVEPLAHRDRCGHLTCGVLLLRGMSLALFALGVPALHRMAMATFGAMPSLAIAAVALAVFVPQVTFIATSISNDGLAAVWAAYVVARLLRPPPEDGRAARRQAAALGAMLGLGWMVKSTLLPLWPLVAFVRPPRGDGHSMTRLSLIALAAAVAVVVALPWATRNVVLYGSVLASAEQLRPEEFAWNLRPKSLFSTYFVTDFPWYLSRSAWGMFGMLNAVLPPTAYAIWHAVLQLAAVGLVLHAARRARRRLQPDARRDAPEGGPLPEGRTLAVLASAIGLTVAGIVYYNLQVTQPQGRYLLPALGPLACAVVLGLSEIAHRVRHFATQLPGAAAHRALDRSAPVGALAVVVALAAINVATLAWVVATYYP